MLFFCLACHLILSPFRPVLYLPHRECSIAIRFSPVKYKLRSLSELGVNCTATDSSSASSSKPWERTRTLFCLPYRMVYAVATQSSVNIYDTQQAEPFARISKIHYISLNDLSWSADGSVLIISSTDGFCSLVSFRDGEIGEVYDDQEIEAQQNATTDKENVNEATNVDDGQKREIEEASKKSASEVGSSDTQRTCLQESREESMEVK